MAPDGSRQKGIETCTADVYMFEAAGVTDNRTLAPEAMRYTALLLSALISSVQSWSSTETSAVEV